MDATDVLDIARLLAVLIDVEAMRAENEAAASEKALPYSKPSFLAQRNYAGQILEHIQYRDNRG